MQSYTIEFSGTGEVRDGQFSDDTEAQSWVEAVLEAQGYDADELVAGDWDSDGTTDGGEQCYRMLYWANESDSRNDPGANSICQLCKVGE